MSVKGKIMKPMRVLFLMAVAAVTVAAWLTACAEGEKGPVSGCPEPGEGPVRMPAVAGGFYPASPGKLGAMVDEMMAAAEVPSIPGRIRVVIAPHAGYVYSGPVAAYAFKAVAGKKYGTVVLIGNSHKEGYHGASVYPRGSFMTPLGAVPIDADLAQRLIDASPDIYFRESAHLPEHSLEVELPFLQRALGEFKLVPVLLGAESMDLARSVSDALAANLGDDALVVISTDLSHYPKYDDANYADGEVIKAVLTGDAEHLERTIRQVMRSGIPNEVTCMCGEGAVKTGMLLAKKIGATDIRLLKYANSGDTAGSRNSVVGYASIAFAGPEGKGEPAPPAAAADEEVLNKEEEDALLKLARLTVETFVRTGKKPEWENRWPALEQPLGAFVTLKEHGRLRGCIGRFQPNLPLYRVVMEMAIAAATQDHRFSPVTEKELGELEYEISVLSPLRKIKSWKEIQLGKHGVQVVRGFRSGVYLPQVATETGWDLETFMSTLCAHKAGLSPNAWMEPGTDLYVFTAQVFHEPAP